MSPRADVLQPIFDALETHAGVKSYFGAEFLAANHAPPRYVWVPSTISFAAPSSLGERLGHRRSLADARATYEVHIWGTTHDEVWDLLAKLATATWEYVGSPDVSFASAEWTETSYAARGHLLIVQIAITVPLIEADLEASPITKAKVTNVQFQDPAGATESDGTLSPPKK